MEVSENKRNLRLQSDFTEEELADFVSLFSSDKMYGKILGFAEAEHLTETAKALPFMKESHEGQYRKPSFFSDKKTPYIAHPLMMACHLHALGIREDAILASALLHDVLEDCDVTEEDLPVGKEVREAVALLTYRPDPAVKKETLKRAYYEGIGTNRIATIVKIIDRCNNISTIAGSFPERRLVSYINETESFVMPLLESARQSYPEFSDALFVVKYHMRSILESLKGLLLRLR